MKEDIKYFVLSLIEKKSKLPKDVDIDAFNYIDSGHIDSVGIIKFVVQIECSFDIEILESDMESPKFKTVGGLISIVTEKILMKAKND